MNLESIRVSMIQKLIYRAGIDKKIDIQIYDEVRTYIVKFIIHLIEYISKNIVYYNDRAFTYNTKLKVIKGPNNKALIEINDNAVIHAILHTRKYLIKFLDTMKRCRTLKIHGPTHTHVNDHEHKKHHHDDDDDKCRNSITCSSNDSKYNEKHITYYQSQKDCYVFAKRSFVDIVETIQKTHKDILPLKWTTNAVFALQLATEDYLVELFYKGSTLKKTKNNTILEPSDLKTVMREKVNQGLCVHNKHSVSSCLHHDTDSAHESVRRGSRSRSRSRSS